MERAKTVNSQRTGGVALNARCEQAVVPDGVPESQEVVHLAADPIQQAHGLLVTVY